MHKAELIAGAKDVRATASDCVAAIEGQRIARLAGTANVGARQRAEIHIANDRHVLSDARSDEIGIAVVRPPLVGHAIDLTIAITHQHTSFETFDQRRIAIIDRQ